MTTATLSTQLDQLGFTGFKTALLRQSEDANYARLPFEERLYQLLEAEQNERSDKKIKRLLSQVLQNEVRDPRVRGVVITQVVVSADFSVASVYVQSMDGVDTQDTLAGLKAAGGFLRSRLSTMFRAKKVPQLRFFLDDTFERLERLEEIFERIEDD